MWTIQLPLRIPCDDRSKPVKHRSGWEQPYFALNLNQYRNAQFFTLNNAKVNFEIAIRKLIRAAGIPKLKRCSLEYVLYPGTAQLCDVANICSIADKFFSDALKASKIIEDDNYQFLSDLRFRFGRIDRENPRVEVIIRNSDQPSTTATPEEGPKPMKIQTRSTHVVNLTQEDLVTALRKFLAEHITIPDDATLGTLVSLTDGTFELRIESGAPVVEKPKAKPGPKPKLDPKAAMAAVGEALKHKEEGTAAPSSPAPETPVTTTEKPAETTTGAAAPAKPVLSAKEQAAKEAEEMEAAEKAGQQPAAPTPSTDETPTAEPGEKVNEYDLRSKEEAEQESATTVDHSPKTDLEKKLETVRGTPDEAEVKAEVEKERAIKADPIKAMQEAKTLAELDRAFELSDKGKSAKACYGACKETLPAPVKKKGLFDTFTRPTNKT